MNLRSSRSNQTMQTEFQSYTERKNEIYRLLHLNLSCLNSKENLINDALMFEDELIEIKAAIEKIVGKIDWAEFDQICGYVMGNIKTPSDDPSEKYSVFSSMLNINFPKKLSNYVRAHVAKQHLVSLESVIKVNQTTLDNFKEWIKNSPKNQIMKDNNDNLQAV